jgi:hypothetical protein
MTEGILLPVELLNVYKIRNLIIDMRHNSGGNLDIFPPLLRTIMTLPSVAR